MANAICIIISMLIWLPKGQMQPYSLFKRVGKEMVNGTGVLRNTKAYSRGHCAQLCLQFETCSAFQINKTFGLKHEADCVLIDETASAVETTSSNLDYFEFVPHDCSINCFNGGVERKRRCECKCPTSPTITRGPNCEQVCNWNWHTDQSLPYFAGDETSENATSHRDCQDRCLARESCLSCVVVPENPHDFNCTTKRMNASIPGFTDKLILLQPGKKVYILQCKYKLS